MAGRALVLGGGGVTGVAWELGIIAGLAEEGIDLTAADVIVGTSAGSIVGAIIASGEPVAAAYERQLRPPPAADRAAKVGPTLILRYVAAAASARDPQRVRAKIGALSLRARTIPEQERRRVIADRLGRADWPTRQRLLVTAVAADDGEFVVFDRDSGVSLVDAVSASCAVPGVWPPATVNGRRYIDGGARSPANVDLATECDRVVVLAPIAAALQRDGRPGRQLAALPARGLLIAPDREAARAIGSNVLDGARRGGAARAGKPQGRTAASAVRSVWAAS